MKKIFVRKIFPYDPTFGGKHSKYYGYSLSALKKKSPIITKEIMVRIDNCKKIFNSSLKRGLQTANIVAKQNKVKAQSNFLLNEITFNLQDLLSEEEFQKEGSNLVRKRFIEAFNEDKLLEPRTDIKQRIEKLLKQLSLLPDGKYLLISHSFFMKLLQIYLQDNTIFNNPKILLKYFDPYKKTFDFGKGFYFEII